MMFSSQQDGWINKRGTRPTTPASWAFQCLLELRTEQCAASGLKQCSQCHIFSRISTKKGWRRLWWSWKPKLQPCWLLLLYGPRIHWLGVPMLRVEQYVAESRDCLGKQPDGHQWLLTSWAASCFHEAPKQFPMSLLVLLLVDEWLRMNIHWSTATVTAARNPTGRTASYFTMNILGCASQPLPGWQPSDSISAGLELEACLSGF